MDSIDPRPISDQEQTWLELGLGSLRTGEHFGGGCWVEVATGQVKPRDEPIDPSFWLAQVNGLTVVGKCMCGESNCHTIRFKRSGTARIVALLTSSTTDGRMLIVHIDEGSGELAELEII